MPQKSSRYAANSPASGCTNPVSSGQQKLNSGLAMSSVTRPPPSITDWLESVNGRR